MIREALTIERLSGMTPEEAAAYFVSRQADGFTENEHLLLDRWLASSQANGRALEFAKRAWDSFSDADDDLLQAMRDHALAPKQSTWRSWDRFAAAAAVVAMLFIAGLLLLPGRMPLAGPGNEPVGAAIQYASARGQVREIRLSDGSTMTLDAGSRAVADMAGERRTIHLLEGRAYFAVARDPSRPFQVLANEQRVVAIGTEFDVSLLGAALTVTLVKGRVAIHANNANHATVELKPGQQLIVRNGAGLLRSLESGALGATGWREGLLSFDDQSLGEAAAMVNRYSEDRVVIRDPAVARLRVSGQFRAGDVSRFAKTAAELHGLKAVRTADGTELRR